MAHDRLNVRRVITESLLADAGVSAIVGDRIVGPDALYYEDGTPTFPLLVVAVAGGDSLYSGSYQSLAVELEAHSRVSLGEAGRIVDLARVVLHAKTLSVNGITERVVCTETSGPADDYDTELKTSVCRSRYLAQTTG